MEVLIVAVDEVERATELRASQQPPTHLLLDFLSTWPIPLVSSYLNSRALVKPGYYYTRVERERTPTAILVIDIATPRVSLGSQAEIL